MSPYLHCWSSSETCSLLCGACEMTLRMTKKKKAEGSVSGVRMWEPLCFLPYWENCSRCFFAGDPWARLAAGRAKVEGVSSAASSKSLSETTQRLAPPEAVYLTVPEPVANTWFSRPWLRIDNATERLNSGPDSKCGFEAKDKHHVGFMSLPVKHRKVNWLPSLCDL